MKNKIEIIKEGIKIDPFYLVSEYDAFPSNVHVIDNEDDIETNLDGWHLFFIKNSNYVVQIVNNEYGFDHHCLTENEIRNAYIYYASILNKKR